MEFLILAGRLLVGYHFFTHGLQHFKRFDGTVGYASSRGMASAPILVKISGAGIMAGAAGVVLGIMPQIAILGLVAFLVLVSFMVHNFWKDTDPAKRASEKLSFESNMAIAGALLMALPFADMWGWSIGSLIF